MTKTKTKIEEVKSEKVEIRLQPEKIVSKINDKKEEPVKKTSSLPTGQAGKTAKKKVTSGILSIEATFNNTKVLLADKSGNTLFWSSAGSLGFRGAKKGTPFAASKVGDIIGGKATMDVVVLGVGSGREPAIRAFMAHGIEITSIQDATPVPHNGPKSKKPRRV